MDKRFFNIFNLTEEQAIALLKTPLDRLEDETDRYVTASIKALIDRSVGKLTK